MEAANPAWTSVLLIGWSQVQAFQKLTDAHIMAYLRNWNVFLRTGLAGRRVRQEHDASREAENFRTPFAEPLATADVVVGR